jgi:hypothetical protein
MGRVQPRIPLLENVLAYGVPTSPKLNPAPRDRNQNRSRNLYETASNFGIQVE